MHARDKFYSALLRAKAGAQLEPRDGVEIIRVEEQLDAEAATRIRSDFKRMVQAGRAQAVIDLSGVMGVDSTGLGSLVSALRAVREVGGCIRLVAKSGRMLQVLELTALTRVFKVHDSVSAAIDAFAPAAA